MSDMRLGVLFSGGKDSTLALHRATKTDEIGCLIAVASKNEASYMFHTPNIGLVKVQAESMDIPIIIKETKGEKEKELEDLKQAIVDAVERYQIEGIVTGAVESVYQASRVQKICDELGMWCFNPLWLMDQTELLKELVAEGYEVMITGIFAYPLGKEWLGKIIDSGTITELKELQARYKINPAGEGGEIETTVLDAPLFKKKIIVTKSTIDFKNNAGVMRIETE